MSRRLCVAAVFLDLNIGGDENRTLNFLRAHDRTRLDYVVVTVRRPDEGQDGLVGPMRARYRETGVELLDLGEPPGGPAAGAPAAPARVPTPGLLLRKAGTVGTLARRVYRLARLLRERRVDVVDAHMGATPVAVLAGRLAGVRGVVATDYGTFKWDRPYRRFLARGTYRLVDTLISDSRLRCDEMHRFLAIPSLRTAVICNGIFPPTTAETAATMRRRLGLPEDPRVRVVGQISRLLPDKGQRELLEAARLVLAREPAVAFLVCGYALDPAYRTELERRAEALGIADRVRLVSYPGPVADVWAAIDVHVHASLMESSPVAIAEGMALCKPAVLAAAGGVPELAEHERTALLVPPGEPGPLAEALLRLLGDAELARRLGQAAGERYERCHRPEVMARALEDLFEAVAARGGRRPARTPVRPAAGVAP
jgi:glycosyltransferase involved in cell wall biosynthesis